MRPTWAEQLYPQITGQQLDGVFYMDPYTLASLLELTGPVTLKGNPVKLTSKTAAHTLLVDQYVQLPKGRNRVDFLDEATRVTFEKLTSGDLPKPVKVANVMSPMVDQGHLFGQSTHPDIEALFQQLGLDGAVPSPRGGDFLWVTQSNENPSKIDAYLQRDITYDALFRPDTGEVVGDVKVRLTNSAPAALLPDDVIGNERGKPPGTNHMFLTVYSPLQATGATVDDAAVAVGSVRRFGLSTYTIFVDVPPGGTVTVELKLAGVIPRSRQYQLTVVRQPTVNADHIDVTLNGKEGWQVVGSGSFQVSGGSGKTSVVESE